MATTSTHDRPTDLIRETTERSRKVAGIVFIALAAQFLTVIMLASAIAPDYDFNGAAISDLGVIPETALLFNVSVVLLGLLNIAGGYLFYRVHDNRWLMAVFVIGGIGAVGAGIFPLNTGGLHSLFALVGFLFFNVQALAVATRISGVMRALAIVAGLLGLVFVAIMAVGDAGNTAVFGPIGHNGTERMIVYPVMLWMIALGGYLLGNSETSEMSAE